MTTPALAAPRRFRPTLLPTVVALLGIVVFSAAGNWQRGRMDQKLQLGAQLAEAAALPPAPMPAPADWAPWRFRRVQVSGTYDPQHQILLDNKVYRTRVGYDVVTPLVLADGRVVLVDRGWTPAGATRDDLPIVPPPTGPVAVEGRLNTPPAAFIELQASPPVGPVWQNLDLQRYNALTGVAIVPVIIEQTGASSAGDPLVRDWAAPDFGVDKHRIYMLQWYSFAALAAGLWLYFTLRPAK